MFIFNILFSLILLPFTLIGAGIRLLFGVLGISTHILLWPLKIFARHTIACLVVMAVLILILALKRDPHAVDNLKPKTTSTAPSSRGAALAPAPGTPPTYGPDGKPVVIEPIAKREDGDSAFAADLYALMTDVERIAYSQNFYAAMNTTPDGQIKTWAAGNINGALRPADTFLNNGGSTCRRFGEVLKVHSIEQRLTGIACVKADGTWCKLKPNATPACNLGHEAGPLEGISRAIGDLF